MTARALFILISVVVLAGLVLAMVVVSGPATPPAPDDPWAGVPVWPRPLDHSAFFDAEFADGPSVTRACLKCHPGAAAEVMQTSHWSWAGDRAADPHGDGTVAIGKRNLQNNFCISIAANWPRCTSCHAGYGWTDDSFLQNAGEDRVDCLVCHDGSGQYQKGATGAGHPAPGVDLLAAARSVGRTTRAGCGSCHFKGGGGDGVKHGDLDESMYFPPERVDVHMGKHDLACADCHRAESHRIRGRLLPAELNEETRVSCTDCHDEAPHLRERLNGHTAALACQSCHVPRYAVETGTKLWWDWSKAGIEGDPVEIAQRLVRELLEERSLPPPILDGFGRVGEDPDFHAHYDRKKGLFLVARRLAPEYRWYDRTTRRYLPGQRVEGDGPVAINEPQGSARDPDARIWPFKVHRGVQPFDLEHRHLLSPHTYGEGGYWKEFDWEKALRTGAAASGIEFSGRWTWISTEMYWPQTHMVQRKEDSLRCVDCHGPSGRMDWEALGYPGDPAVQGNRRQMDLLREGEANR